MRTGCRTISGTKRTINKVRWRWKDLVEKKGRDKERPFYRPLTIGIQPSSLKMGTTSGATEVAPLGSHSKAIPPYQLPFYVLRLQAMQHREQSLSLRTVLTVRVTLKVSHGSNSSIQCCYSKLHSVKLILPTVPHTTTILTNDWMQLRKRLKISPSSKMSRCVCQNHVHLLLITQLSRQLSNGKSFTPRLLNIFKTVTSHDAHVARKTDAAPWSRNWDTTKPGGPENSRGTQQENTFTFGLITNSHFPALPPHATCPCVPFAPSS